MGGMFYLCSSLTSIDVSNFDTSNVTDMSSMFEDCSSLISLDLSSINTSKVTDMGYMVGNCSSLTSLDLRNADFSNVNIDNYNNYYNMFDVNTNLNQVIVKDEQQRTWITTRFTWLKDNVVLPSEL